MFVITVFDLPGTDNNKFYVVEVELDGFEPIIMDRPYLVCVVMKMLRMNF